MPFSLLIMPIIKKLVMRGFKSFVKQTEILFTKHLNLVVGPNGSGKSNITDAICFVLGRLSMKSIRAARSANLIFNGGKHGKPAHEATISLVFDNSDKGFSNKPLEVVISRTVRRDGSSVYKIGNETKTRQEILELLASAGIDPHGFNIILQGQIASFTSMPAEKRRQIIEEVAGINVYEIRKEKSLRELEKTNDKLKEIKVILNERSAFLKNLEEERATALKYNKLKKEIKEDKLSVLWKQISEKKIKKEEIEKFIKIKQNKLKKLDEGVKDFREKIRKNEIKIFDIEKEIQRSTGTVQGSLRESISKLKEEIARSEVKKEHFKDQLKSLDERQESLKESLNSLSKEISDLEDEQEEQQKSKKGDKDESVKRKISELSSDISRIKNDLFNIEQQKEKLFLNREELGKKRAHLGEKESYYLDLKQEISELSSEIKRIDSRVKEEEKSLNVKQIKKERREHQKIFEKKQKEIISIKEELTSLLTEKNLRGGDINGILNLDKCPVCKQIVSEKYKKILSKDFEILVSKINSSIKDKNKQAEEVSKHVSELVMRIEEFVELEKRGEIVQRDLEDFESKRARLEKLKNQEKDFLREIDNLKEIIKDLEKREKNPKILNEKYDELKFKLESYQEKLTTLKSTSKIDEFLDRDFDIELSLNRRDKEKTESIIKQNKKERISLEASIKNFTLELIQKKKELKIKEKEDFEIVNKFKKSLEEKKKLQEEVSESELKINKKQADQFVLQAANNEAKITLARIGAEIETKQEGFNELKGEEEVKIIKNIDIQKLEAQIKRNEIQLASIGNINLRALEVYDKVKEEYNIIKEKTDKLEGEKEVVLKIIEQIDKKKKISFLKTFNAINNGFSSNFLKLSTKGKAFLELENPQNPFDGGILISVRIAKGKYLDIHSLSGGEKVLITLSLLFAIQDYNPYSFYLFDEIDAALDKRNSERLARLIKTNIKKAQYIVVSHNDSLISVADVLYGVTMQDGVSKIISMNV